MTRTEHGSALVLVLVLLTVLSLALGGMFANAGANLTTSSVITERNDQVYAADAGIESTIQQLRASSTLCGTAATASTDLPAISINGRSVASRCRTTAGAATSVSPWALVTTNTGSSSVSQSGGSATIDGPVYTAGGVNLRGTLAVESGLYQQSTAPCPGLPPLSRPTNLTPSSPWACTDAPLPYPDAAQVPTLPPALPGLINLTDRGHGPAFVAPATQCSIFLPGKYTNGINLGPHNYFASGIYYFEDTPLVLTGDLVGGRPGRDEVRQGPMACANDTQAGVDNGTGVELILGGDSAIDVGAFDLELYSRSPGSRAEGGAGVSIRTVPPGGLPYAPSSAGSNVLDMASGAHLVVHGMVYVPGATVHLLATNPAGADLLGGLECFRINIGPSDRGSSGRLISAQDGGQSRSVVITATVQPTGSQPAVTSTAVVAIGNDPARTVTVDSWVTTNP